uniref:Uncharacterized protein n=1 Tax=Tanacetum cinerariifolium TaxID=118510 RepID=A0A6L2N5L3_TANCI|nr:hypothetical protein [Tanacetum cinerariifolium]
MEHLAKDGEKDVFCSINEEFEKFVDSDINTPYHSRSIRQEHQGFIVSLRSLNGVSVCLLTSSFLSETDSEESTQSTRGEEEISDKNKVAIGDNTENPTETKMETPAKKAEMGNEAESKAVNEETTEAP